MPHLRVEGIDLDIALDGMVSESEHNPNFPPKALTLMRLAAEMLRMQQAHITELGHIVEHQTRVLQGGIHLMEQISKKCAEEVMVPVGVLFDVHDVLGVLKQ